MTLASSKGFRTTQVVKSCFYQGSHLEHNLEFTGQEKSE
jgi:hypothetical protein